jgi:hypothetical protein
MNRERIINIVINVSNDIVSRISTGQHWTEDTNSLKGYYDKTGSTYQLVHRLTESKLLMHASLCELLTTIVR